MSSRNKKEKPLWLLLLTDLLLLGVLLVVFAYFHHVRPSTLEGENIVITRPTQAAVQTPQPTSTPVPPVSDPGPVETEEPLYTAEPVYTAEPEATPAVADGPEGSFGAKFADKFTNGEVIQEKTDTEFIYKSRNLNVDITVRETETTSGTCRYYVTDFYIRDITCLRTTFAKDKFGKSVYEWMKEIAERTGAVVTVNGDFYGIREYGVVIRNGVLYRSAHSSLDACAIYWNGEMETFASKDWDTKDLVAKGAYQAWSFGPRLLDYNGQPMKSFNATKAVEERNPRTAIGYFEPGHYCFVTVDGRSGSSKGLRLADLSQLMYDLGCVSAYNLDGGQTTELCIFDTVSNKPYDGGRKMTDAIGIFDSILE